jgi:protein TonB
VRGDWRYGGDFSKHKRWPWTAMAISAAIHLFVLYGFNDRPKPKKVTESPPADLVLIDLSKLKPESDDDVTDSVDKLRTDDAANAPTIPDLPMAVALNNDFVQPIDVSTLVPDFSSSKKNLMTIPPVVHHGIGNGGKGMSDLFNMADLDRMPQALYRVVPRVPKSLITEAAGNQVVIEFIVNKKGDVVAADIVKEPSHELGELALKSVLKWHFRPGMKTGKVVNTRVRQPIIFSAESTKEN